jgi:hypothetical protein
VTAVAWLGAGGAVSPAWTLHPVLPPTEAQLRVLLASRRCEIAVLCAPASARSAGYATLMLADSQGQPRAVNAQPLGQLLARQGVRLAVLCGEASEEAARSVASAWIDKGVRTVVALGAAPLAAQRLLALLAEGESVSAALQRAAVLMPARALAQVHGDAELRWGDGSAAPPAPTPGPPATPVTAAAPTTDPLAAKRAANAFDVFLCHNSADKPSVKRIGTLLKTRGLLPWLDEWELPPGQPWQERLERQIASIRSAAVFIGGSGISPWHQQEMRGFISEFVDRQVPVIPVLLPEAPARPELPLFLRQMTWVDFRTADPDPLERLVWGITGTRPGAQ